MIVLRPIAKHTATLIWLHGLGGPASDYLPGLASLQRGHPRLAGLRIVLPEAPERHVASFNGRQIPAWYDMDTPRGDVLGGNEHPNKKQLDGAADDLDAVIEREIERHRVHVDRFFVAGVGQGGALAFYSYLRNAINSASCGAYDYRRKDDCVLDDETLSSDDDTTSPVASVTIDIREGIPVPLDTAPSDMEHEDASTNSKSGTKTTFRWARLAGVAGLSAWLPVHAHLHREAWRLCNFKASDKVARPSVLLTHNERDSQLPYGWVTQTRSWLRVLSARCGSPVKNMHVARIGEHGHNIGAAHYRELGAWIVSSLDDLDELYD